ncbi:prepilin-type N-terminal cleavage/methylation domain-containing protein [Legionella longbeachae]|uniref:Tfp pilus assembly protein PilV n=1 Tax=Legionella longbeachae serogroup 1 (strain NSW150) TaxID=661367 RepID=D3HS23_LEGLN|nr:prepilin-type N-terminal cleavage/methylation domain-containing protein [Legionella longbeachae]VEE02203.1 Tfp pilus assembly protein PilV [Legionella oakridgensis]HBD7399370.1 prepilin-type N-terminal cleavage/methylation domain-containing protein [Legionella pneumophila]ARB91494.1 prepilin-type cleavage/methylation domain-containing protein [Legionella longbeachae]ARM32081.1 prepilin-type N-terminal cleavage/methylation domain-containing protein [Legionella longbeachae]EEZ95165.1 conserve
MNQQKGFSLIEVLLSLLLVTTLAIALIEQQSQSKYLLNQLLIRTQATHHLDQIEETLMTKIKKAPFPPPFFHLDLQHKSQEIFVKLAWHDQLNFIVRKHSSIELK